MTRILITGNAGGGKSVLARKIAAARGLPYFEIDAIVWGPGWRMIPQESYAAEHAKLIAADEWVLDGLGWLESLPARFARATEIVLSDMPLWMHFWLAAERQMQWARGTLEHPVAGVTEMPATKEMFEALWETDRDMMPTIRALADAAERDGKPVIRIASVEALNRLSLSV